MLTGNLPVGFTTNLSQPALCPRWSQITTSGVIIKPVYRCVNPSNGTLYTGNITYWYMVSSDGINSCI